MENNQIKFTNGGAYENYMGKWSQRVGHAFLEWVKPEPGLRWLDIGCGNGAFTETIVERCSPHTVEGIDPSEPQITFARARASLALANFRVGDAMALPYAENEFDVAVMPLVIFFVPKPAQGLAEMVRVVAPGGFVLAYAWDRVGGGFPYMALNEEMRAMGFIPPMPPSVEASQQSVLQELWMAAGLEFVATREIVVERTFENFEHYWTTILGGPSVGPQLAAMDAMQISQLQMRMRERLPADREGRITYSARANAVMGRVP